MNDDLDIRIADALFDVAAGTRTSKDAFGTILRRAESSRPSLPGRRRALVASVAAMSGIVVAGIILLRPEPSAAPGASPAVVSAPASSPAGASAPPPTLPSAGYVEGDLFYYDATLLAQLHVNFGVGNVEDEARMRDDGSASIDYTPVAECMESQGWQYFPPTGDVVDALTTHPSVVMAPADFAAQYGFGIAAEALGALAPVYPRDESGFEDYMRTLSPAEQQAYMDAEGQCQKETGVYDDVPIADQSWVNAKDYVWTQFEPLVRGDARVADALAAWGECMAAEGFEFESPEATESAFHQRVNDLELFGETPEEGSAEDEELDAIMTDEIAVATVNAECVVPYDETLRTVIAERLPEFKQLLQAAIDAGVDSGGVGLR